MESDALVVPRAEFAIEEPWAIPAPCRPVDLVRVTDGRPPRLRTTLSLYADRDTLTSVFSAADDGIVATHMAHDAPLYEEDVVELFLAPEGLSPYYEIEVNPLGTTFDARITSPDGVRATMRGDINWTCRNLFAAVRRTPASLEIVVRVPFASFGDRGRPWRANFFRIDRSRGSGDEFTAWRPTLKNPPDFHVAAAFGRLDFN